MDPTEKQRAKDAGKREEPHCLRIETHTTTLSVLPSRERPSSNSVGPCINSDKTRRRGRGRCPFFKCRTTFFPPFFACFVLFLLWPRVCAVRFFFLHGSLNYCLCFFSLSVVSWCGVSACVLDELGRSRCSLKGERGISQRMRGERALTRPCIYPNVYVPFCCCLVPA